MSADSQYLDLIRQYVAAWQILDGFVVEENLDDRVLEFHITQHSEGSRLWQPATKSTDESSLQLLYSKLPARFPRLYEILVLNYRWPEVQLGEYRLIGNPIGADLSGLLIRILKDKFLSDFLLKKGYIQLGKGPDLDYDPVCFDLSSRKKNGDFAIVKIDHEEILSNEKLKVVAELAPSFEALVRSTILQAKSAK